MPNLGIPELLIIFLIIVVIFGASRLPKLGGGLGEGIRNFRKGLAGGQEDESSDTDDEAKAGEA